MSNPFTVVGPTAISFSGGRTSAYMLRRVLDAHGGTLPVDARVVFANTGKERPETLDFVHECETRWGVPVTWLEFQLVSQDGRPEDVSAAAWQRDHGWRVVSYETASRDGGPFADLIRWKRFLPNVVTRICTQHLKVGPMLGYLRRACGWTEWTSFIGIRHDEPRRWKIRGPSSRNAAEDRHLPLADAGVTKADVMAFWAAQPFDLQLHPWEGNCDLCFLKGRAKVERCIRDRPALADWWIEREREVRLIGAEWWTFRSDRPSYEKMAENIRRSPLLPIMDAAPDGNDDVIDCLCSEAA